MAKLDTALATIRAKSAKEEALSQQVMQLESRLASVVSEKDTSLSRSRLNDRAHAEEMARQVKEFEIQESRLKTAEDGLQRLRTERQEMVVQLESLQHEVCAARSSLSPVVQTLTCVAVVVRVYVLRFVAQHRSI